MGKIIITGLPKVYHETKVTNKYSTDLIILDDDALLNWKNITPSACGHYGVEDEPGWSYDIRHCVVCGTSLGFI